MWVQFLNKRLNFPLMGSYTTGSYIRAKSIHNIPVVGNIDTAEIANIKVSSRTDSTLWT